MTKANIIEIISEHIDITKKDISIIVDNFFDKIKKGMRDNKHIELRRFGTFGTKERKARIARNPKTNKKINIPEHRIPYFKAGKDLKSLVVNK